MYINYGPLVPNQEVEFSKAGNVIEKSFPIAPDRFEFIFVAQGDAKPIHRDIHDQNLQIFGYFDGIRNALYRLSYGCLRLWRR